MSYSYADLKAGLIETKVIENGVKVPPNLQIGEMTLTEHNDYLKWLKQQKPLDRREAIAAGHRPKEVAETYGPAVSELAPPKPPPPLVALGPTINEYDDLAATVGPTVTGNELYQEARAKGYTGDICPSCNQITMVNNGTCLVCVGCGHTSGCS